jgi:hypothetical protein
MLVATVVGRSVAGVLTHARPATGYLVGKDARLLATVGRYLPTRILESLHRSVFRLPAPGYRVAAVIRGGTR